MPMLDRGDATVWWQVQGAGPSVLLLNGLSSPSGTWHRLLPHLIDHFRVITMDNRGVGRTGLPAGPVTIDAMAADAVAVLQAAGDEPAHVLGHSMGGLIAQELAVTAPGYVRSLILVGTHVGLPHAFTLGPEGTLDADAIKALTEGASAPAAERTRAMQSVLYADATDPVLIAEDEAVRDLDPTSEAGYQAQLLGAGPWERRAELPSLTLPTLVLHGAIDRLVPPAHGRLLAESIPGAQLALVAGAGHELFTDQPDATITVLLDFLTRISLLKAATV